MLRLILSSTISVTRCRKYERHPANRPPFPPYPLIFHYHFARDSLPHPFTHPKTSLDHLFAFVSGMVVYSKGIHIVIHSFKFPTTFVGCFRWLSALSAKGCSLFRNGESPWHYIIITKHKGLNGIFLFSQGRLN